MERPYQNRGNQQSRKAANSQNSQRVERQQVPDQNNQRVERQQVPNQNSQRMERPYQNQWTATTRLKRPAQTQPQQQQQQRGKWQRNGNGNGRGEEEAIENTKLLFVKSLHEKPFLFLQISKEMIAASCG